MPYYGTSMSHHFVKTFNNFNIMTFNLKFI